MRRIYSIAVIVSLFQKLRTDGTTEFWKRIIVFILFK